MRANVGDWFQLLRYWVRYGESTHAAKAPVRNAKQERVRAGTEMRYAPSPCSRGMSKCSSPLCRADLSAGQKKMVDLCNAKRYIDCIGLVLHTPTVWGEISIGSIGQKASTGDRRLLRSRQRYCGHRTSMAPAMI